jgi:adenylate kinase
MKKNKLAIIMLGAPGSGKGTQGELLEKHTGFKRYVMSDLIKKELQPGNKLYDKIFKQGILLNDNNIFDIFRKHFNSDEEIILDGLPRTLDQAYWLYGFLLRHKYEIELVFLNVDEEKLLSRITSRRYCPRCHRLYNTETKKSKVEGVCDDDQEKLIQREDDTKQVFGERLQIFDEVRDVILDVYKGDVIEVNGDQNIEEVSRDILKKIIIRS